MFSDVIVLETKHKSVCVYSPTHKKKTNKKNIYHTKIEFVR